MFLEISQYLQENICAKDFFLKESLAQVFSCEISEFFKNIFFYRTSLMAASNILEQYANFLIMKNGNMLNDPNITAVT